MPPVQLKETGFPSREQTQDELLLLVFKQGGSITLKEIRDKKRNRDIYNMLADRFSLTQEARTRKTPSESRPAWHQEVRFCRQALIDSKPRLLEDKPESGHGVWTLTTEGMVRAKALTQALKAENNEVEADDQEVTDADITFVEGSANEVLVTKYERNPEARRACISHHGAKCSVCRFDFANVYGSVADGYIEVHHIRPVSAIRREYQIDPINDLRPVCPNCHAVIHISGKCRTIEDVQGLMKQRKKS